MSIAPLASSTLAASYSQPAVQPQAAKAPQKAAVADQVTISKQAQQLASDGDPAALEATETAAEKAAEATKAKA